MSKGSAQRQQLNLEWLAGRFAVCRLAPDAALPDWASGSSLTPQAPSLLSITRTDRELSIVIDQTLVKPQSSMKVQAGFAAMRVVGTLNFALVGILAQLTGALAEAKVPVFVISTFDTDVLLIPEQHCAAATAVLRNVGEFEVHERTGC